METGNRIKLDLDIANIFAFPRRSIYPEAPCAVSGPRITDLGIQYEGSSSSMIFRRNAIAFRAIGIGHLMFVRSVVRTTRNQLLEYIENRLT